MSASFLARAYTHAWRDLLVGTMEALWATAPSPRVLRSGQSLATSFGWTEQGVSEVLAASPAFLQLVAAAQQSFGLGDDTLLVAGILRNPTLPTFADKKAAMAGPELKAGFEELVKPLRALMDTTLDALEDEEIDITERRFIRICGGYEVTLPAAFGDLIDLSGADPRVRIDAIEIADDATITILRQRDDEDPEVVQEGLARHLGTIRLLDLVITFTVEPSSEPLEEEWGHAWCQTRFWGRGAVRTEIVAGRVRADLRGGWDLLQGIVNAGASSKARNGVAAAPIRAMLRGAFGGILEPLHPTARWPAEVGLAPVGPPRAVVAGVVGRTAAGWVEIDNFGAGDEADLAKAWLALGLGVSRGDAADPGKALLGARLDVADTMLAGVLREGWLLQLGAVGVDAATTLRLAAADDVVLLELGNLLVTEGTGRRRRTWRVTGRRRMRCELGPPGQWARFVVLVPDGEPELVEADATPGGPVVNALEVARLTRVLAGTYARVPQPIPLMAHPFAALGGRLEGVVARSGWVGVTLGRLRLS